MADSRFGIQCGIRVQQCSEQRHGDETVPARSERDGGLPAHRSRVVRDYVESLDGHIQLERLPAYAPELNPVEYLFGYANKRELANVCVQTIAVGVIERIGDVAHEQVRVSEELARHFVPDFLEQGRERRSLGAQAPAQRAAHLRGEAHHPDVGHLRGGDGIREQRPRLRRSPIMAFSRCSPHPA